MEVRKMARKRTSKEGPFIRTARAKKRPGKTVAPGGTQVIKPRKKGQKPLAFEKGALHKALGVPLGEKIPESKKKAALAGKYGPEVKKMAVFAFKGALAKGRKTAARRKAKK